MAYFTSGEREIWAMGLLFLFPAFLSFYIWSRLYFLSLGIEQSGKGPKYRKGKGGAKDIKDRKDGHISRDCIFDGERKGKGEGNVVRNEKTVSGTTGTRTLSSLSCSVRVPVVPIATLTNRLLSGFIICCWEI